MVDYIGSMMNMLKSLNLFSGYILWLMMVYLTDVWELEFVHAAAIINIWVGFIKILPIVFAHLADVFLGNYFVVVFSSFSSMIGLGLIWMSTPPVLGKSNGHCTQYKAECIGEQQKQLYYTGLVFTAFGMSALSACCTPVAQEEPTEESQETTTKQDNGRMNRCGNHLAAIAPLLIAAFVKSWAILFGICALLALVHFLCICLTLLLKVPSKPQGSPLTTIFRTLFAASSKISCSRPQNIDDLYQKADEPLLETLPHTKGLGYLDKAAIIKEKPVLEQQEKNRWTLCKVTEVEETKMFIRMIPIWMTFIVCGIVSSLGATFFLEQAKRMNPKVGSAKTPLILFFWFYDHFRKSFTSWLLAFFSLNNRRHTLRVGIAIAMVYGTLACIAAARIESRRLRIVKNHDLLDKPNERVPMTIFWLTFQFVLLGCHDGLQRLCAYVFSVDQAPKSMIKYFNLFARGFVGVGVLGSVALVAIVGKISEGRAGTSWFQTTLNTSRLDNYYWVLAASSAMNFVIFIVVAKCYRYRVMREGPLAKGLLPPITFMDDDHI